MISCVLLAGGLSRRFGSPKSLAELDGVPVIRRIQEILVSSKVDEVIVVLGAHSDVIEPHLLNHTKVTSVYNKDYKLGQTSSFKAGLEAVADDSQGVMLLPVDIPLIREKTFNLLADEFAAQLPPILIPAHQEHRGHPPVFHADLKRQILEMDNSEGLNVFEHQHENDVRVIEVDDPGVLLTFNTPEEFEKLKSGI